MRPARGRRGAVTLVALAALSLVLPGCGLFREAAGGTDVTADFARGTGLYPGSPVRVLGIDVGRITDVDNVDGIVRVRMHLDEGTKVPADVRATIVPLTLLGERYVQMGPAWTSGPTLADGAEIPLDRTSVPAEIDELLRGLQDFVGAIDPEQASNVVTDLADVLEGQGKTLNDLIGNASGTLDLLADKGDDLRAIIASLGDLSATLKSRTGSIETLIRNYDLVAQVLVDNKGDLDATITQLDRAATELTELLVRHEDPLRDDVDVLTRTVKTVDANTENLQTTLSATVDLFAAAGRAYDARTNSLALNNQLNPGLTSDVIAGRFRDRIAGLCRRLGIEICSDPASPLLNDLVGLLPGLLGDLANGTPLGSPPVEPDASTAGAELPPTTAPAPALPPAPDAEALLAALTGELTAELTQAQRDLLAGLDVDRLGALLGIDPLLLQILPELSAEQLELVNTVDVADLPQTLLDLTNQIHPPKDRLTPILPPAGTTPPGPAPAPGGRPTDPLTGLIDTIFGGGS